MRRLPLLFLVAALLAGCAKREEPPCVCGGASPVVDTRLLAFLSQARALHHEADLAESDRDAARAIAALERLLASPVVSAEPAAPEVDEVVADTRARLAELRIGRGDFDAAARDVEAGLARAKEPTYFRGHLFEVLGLVEEKRAAAFESAGDAAAAREAKRRAIDASEKAVSIQEDVIRRALEEEKKR